ncbi:MAG TPA: sensor histidine kinase, partial [bacterium]|nr:sensor histidine kinase [bacterium]
MKTYYASPQRQTRRDLDQDIHTITRNPVIDALLHSVAGLVAVLNEYRQIVSVNEAYLRYLGINDPNELLGLRPGESVRCVHATEMPGGCGTSRHCASCGAAIAIVTSLSDEITSERTCAVEVETASGSSDLFFNVRAHPIRIEGRRFTLLFLQDITREQQWAGLERVFLHDIRNSVGSILGWSELLIQDVPQSISEDMKSLHRAARRLARDIELQRDLLLNKFDDLKPVLRKTTAQHVFTALIDANTCCAVVFRRTG